MNPKRIIYRSVEEAKRRNLLRWTVRCVICITHIHITRILNVIQFPWLLLKSYPWKKLHLLKTGVSIHWTGRLLVPVEEFESIKHAQALSRGYSITQLNERQEVIYDPPVLSGPIPSGWEKPWPPVSVVFPALIIAEWHEALFVGRSDSMYVNGYAVHNDNWNSDTEFTYDEVHGFIAYNCSKVVLRRFANLKIKHIDKAVVIIGGVTPNWAHWTTEYLPKIALVDLESRYHSWPILVDAELPLNILDSIKLISSSKREIIELKQGELIKIKTAVTITSPGYTAYEYRYNKKNALPNFKREHTIFSPFALNLLRERAWHIAKASIKPTRLLYIKRPAGSMRPFSNECEIEKFFATEGFEIIDTSKMSFIEQVQLFSQALCITGPSGAGIVNFVYAPPGCSVLIFAANSPHGIFHYFANMGSAVQHNVFYCYGESNYATSEHPGHVGFSIDFNDVRSIWTKIKINIQNKQSNNQKLSRHSTCIAK